MSTYAVGDIHGCFDGLRLVLERIAQHSGGKAARVVLLGDYVNIGPDSRKVLDCLIDTPSITALRGHHDMMLLAAARGDTRSVWNFDYHGGGQTLRSFGVAKASEIPDRYTDFLRRKLVPYVEDAHRVFVHASIDPAIGEMDLQDETLLLCARAPLAPTAGLFPRFLVHGHFPQADGLPEILPHRCNLDTAGCQTGVFTCGIFDDSQPDPIDIIQVR
ncbi:metallophosphoesterase [Methylobacterium sp. J-076]|uniref:metallophosphoesterase n=1 Tax=Methylobacterium sp. J-076 TaxID=2836655 RepID=UPI001FBB76E9|nr:metallophosphoesterase [Methylobacterium sp. J-076]MCJ2015472.1 metallophosphoesterase [Methylobacterium sp. J-076]